MLWRNVVVGGSRSELSEGDFVMKNLALVILIFISLTTLVSAQQVNSIKVNGKTIKVGETFDKGSLGSFLDP